MQLELKASLYAELEVLLVPELQHNRCADGERRRYVVSVYAHISRRYRRIQYYTELIIPRIATVAPDTL
jgi:hypothetical protein